MNFYELSNKELGHKSGVYKLSIEDHIYIGSSKNLYARLIEHRRDLSKNKHSNSFLQNVCNKYGIENFLVEIIEYCNSDIRIQREKFWIDTLKADMNLQDPVTKEFSEESKKKLSESLKVRYLSGKYKNKFDLAEVECYNYFGDYVCNYKNKEDAAKNLNISKKDVQKLASGYVKGLHKNGIRLRYSNSKTTVQKFFTDPNQLGRYFDFYYIDENGDEKLAFTSIKNVFKFLSEQVNNKTQEIRLVYKTKKFRESGEGYEESEVTS